MNRKSGAPLFALLLLVGGCTSSGTNTPTESEGAGASGPPHNPAEFVEGEQYEPQLDAADFVEGIDNRYLPWTPGTTLLYEGGGERVEVTVTDETREILGITATVVHDQVLTDGEVTEDTFDWYAQDRWGNVWYLGEDTKEYENGKLKTTEGSWQAGVDGAQPGIIVPAHPKPGMTYREEYYAGQAEDGAEILSLTAHAHVPYGTFDHVLQTRNFTPIEPDLVEEKFYVSGVGPVLEITVTGGSDRTELLQYEH
jgi:hypothetical protein